MDNTSHSAVGADPNGRVGTNSNDDSPVANAQQLLLSHSNVAPNHARAVPDGAPNGISMVRSQESRDQTDRLDLNGC